MVGTRDIINKAECDLEVIYCKVKERNAKKRGRCGAGVERAKKVASAIQKTRGTGMHTGGDRRCLESGW